MHSAHLDRFDNEENKLTRPLIFGAPEGHDARILADMAKAAARDDKILIHVAQDDVRLETLQNLIAFFAPETEVLSFPAWDCLPYDRVSPGTDLMAQRVSTLCKLNDWREERARKPRILLCTLNALSQKVPPPETWEAEYIHIKGGKRLDQAKLETYLTQNGYVRTDTVRGHGEYAVRGGLIDLFPAGTEEPVRIDLFGDEVESLKYFDPETQKTTDTFTEFQLYPAREYILDETHVKRFRQQYRELFGARREDDPLYETVSAGRIYNGMEHWLPLFFEKMVPITHYAKDFVLTFDPSIDAGYEARFEQIDDFYQARKTLERSQTQKKSKDVSLSGSTYHPLPPEQLFITPDEWQSETDRAQILSPFPAPETEANARKGKNFSDVRAVPDGDVFTALKDYLSTFEAAQSVSPRPHGERARERGYKPKPDPETIKFARELRQNNTEAEKKLWVQLKAKRVNEHKFRRQHPIEPYVVDFICIEKKLIIELDGCQHDQLYQYDQERTNYLNGLGYRVIRFSNEEIDQNLDGVVDTIAQHLDAPLTPSLSPAGRGGDKTSTQKKPKFLITARTDGAKDRLKIFLDNANFSGLKELGEQDTIKKLKSGDIGLCTLDLDHGFVSDDLVVVTEQDLLGDQLIRKTKSKRRADNFLKEVSTLNAGDLIVHIDHGVGRFEGLETLSAGGALHDCLKLIYAGDDKLYIPVEHIETLSRFGADEGTVQLDKLGGAGWQARKSKVKKDLMKIAGKLMDLAAARLLQKSDPLILENAEYQKFAARFPYAETNDQLRSINAVIEDLGKNHPMDRLVCGDVGFGKTEVAIRAAYVAAKAGAQVALVVPTTLLARQHYANFKERFENTGLQVAQLSRMLSTKEAAQVKKDLAEGRINIVIGTHALFSNDVKFAHLGLLIIDEEQRFGVKQKEKLKEFKNNIHVLTLSATPIPRTLQMSLAGVRELSLITTPPIDRLAIRTFVTPYDPLVIREALLREHHRGGQSFYVCPRIKDMRELEEQIKELVPEIKLVSAHGQMSSTDLEERVSAFYDRKYDVLLATNIIESGIDIPNANTMIIHRADMFGLAQLYQIRGRIGRSKQRAYAYLTYPANKKLTDQGQKRLEVISTLDTLGAGFQLASHDMDIRGAGNLVGEEQSGHIREVGVELYQQMLEEAVAAAKAGVSDIEKVYENITFLPQINLGTSVLIPESYVPDLGVRMTLYRRLPELKAAQEVEQFAAEMIDRFGPLPAEFENLLDIVKIKQICLSAGIDRVDAGPKGVVIGFYQDTPPNLEGLVQWMGREKGTAKLRPDQKISLPRAWEDLGQRVKGVQKLVKELGDLGI